MAKNDKHETKNAEVITAHEAHTTDTNAEAAEPAVKAIAKPKVSVAKEASTEGLVKMHKDGVNLHVHPTTVNAHASAGWKVV